MKMQGLTPDLLSDQEIEAVAEYVSTVAGK